MLAKEIQTTLRRMAMNKQGKTGRFAREIETSCSLDFVEFSAGSVHLAFELAPLPPEEARLWPDAGRESLERLVDVLDGGEQGRPGWSDGLTNSVLDGLSRITKPLDNGIESLTFRLTDGRTRTAKITRGFRQRIAVPSAQRPVPDEATLEGVIWEADWRKHTAELHLAGGVVVIVQFDADRDEEITEARKKRVVVTGVYEPGTTRRISLRRLEIVDTTPLEQPTDGSGFWQELSVEQLAESQSVEPVASPDDLAGDWPVDERLDDFLDAVRRGRQ